MRSTHKTVPLVSVDKAQRAMDGLVLPSRIAVSIPAWGEPSERSRAGRELLLKRDILAFASLAASLAREDNMGGLQGQLTIRDFNENLIRARRTLGSY